ncbi:esterase/lipase family protein [Syntrophomonas palmitatica]|uniref:esterase/lipase family protein n=1 Tax=Syntrophomonas palmitatica TaxID=402877 RepID=UPI0006D22EBB|nr:alpha/beta fold hydrolase [Syntrophomonas palmitatica]
MSDRLSSQPFLNMLGNSGQELIQHFSRSMFLGVGSDYHHSHRFWEKVERRQVDSLENRHEPFCNENRHHDLDIISAFGSSTPKSNNYLLHFAPGWDSNLHKTPVLLVHGAGLDATSFTDLFAMGYTGLQQQLIAMGYRVFAVTFSHLHGDNYVQAEQLADAIARVKEATGQNKVNLVAHSKGGMAARIYLCGLAHTPYQDDVNRYIMLGTPNLGVDFTFRNPLVNYLIYTSSSSGVMAWDRLMVFGAMVDVTSRAIYKDGCFPGQSQMLYRWDGEYGIDPMQPDWWTTYYGGAGLFSHSRGINQAIADGGNMIEVLNRHGLPPEIEFSVLAGSKHLFHGVPGDESGPGDGLVFVDSVFYTDSLAREGARLRDKCVLPVNHMQLLYSERVCRWVDLQLQE